jgi:hypothetical protein
MLPSFQQMDVGHARARPGSRNVEHLTETQETNEDDMENSQESASQTGVDELMEDPESAKDGSSIATALRKRTGSLRKAAMAKMREGSSSSRRELVLTQPHNGTRTMSTSDEIAAPFGAQRGPYISTTDEEESMSFQRPPISTSSSSFEHNTQKPAPSLSPLRSRQSISRALLPGHTTPDELDIEDDWDYSETEWWGWVILIVTWIVFVLVMGSCFGVWSWAWDVGETPYAPPDLEDDDTLPITGYYPALMVCTAVMSWVWVVVAWTGMKYFRHSKIADDG